MNEATACLRLSLSFFFTSDTSFTGNILQAMFLSMHGIDTYSALFLA